MQLFSKVLFSRVMISTGITALSMLFWGGHGYAEMMTCGNLDNSAQDAMICTNLTADMSRGTIAYCAPSTRLCHSTAAVRLTSSHIIERRKLLIAPIEVDSGVGTGTGRGLLIFCYEAPRYPGDGGYFPCLIQFNQGELSIEAELSMWTDLVL